MFASNMRVKFDGGEKKRLVMKIIRTWSNIF